MIKETAQLLVDTGLKDAGYVYLNLCVHLLIYLFIYVSLLYLWCRAPILSDKSRKTCPPTPAADLATIHHPTTTATTRDDCWEAANRTAEGRLAEDPTRFPSGLKALGDFIHGLGLKFGIVRWLRAHENNGRVIATTGSIA